MTRKVKHEIPRLPAHDVHDEDNRFGATFVFRSQVIFQPQFINIDT